MPKVSVIVPVFNVEHQIKRCAESLFSQTLKDIEYIFVDDCSPDRSIQVLDGVIAKYPHRNIRILKMEQNSGLAAVRNYGKSFATGDYMIHCDSDDWVDTDFYEKLYNTAVEQDADIVVADFIREGVSSHDIFTTVVSDSPREMLRLMPQKSFYCMVWNKLVRRDLITAHDIKAIPGCNMWEDVYVCIKMLYYANRIAKVNNAFYHYWINPISYTLNSANDRSFAQRKMCISAIEEFFADKDEDWSLFINYWKMLSKLHLLSGPTCNPRRWRREYPESICQLDLMTSFTPSERRNMHVAYKYPTLHYMKQLPYNLLSSLYHKFRGIK